MPKTIALLYHEVIDDYSESGFQNKDNLAYMHKTEVFRRHLEIFKNHLNSGNSKVENHLFTFDDGGISNLKSARILEENDWKGIYFITTKRIGTSGFLAENDIRTLHENGHIIGSHSHTHPMIFRSLTYVQMLEEWKVSKEILEEILGEEILHCSVPGGDSDLKTYESAVEAGFKYIFDSEPIVETRKLQNADIFGRFSVKAQTTDQQFSEMLSLKNLASLQRNRKIKAKIKKLIFPIHQYIQNRKNE
ncbi:polysaccharide deacetylase family protein [Moheibacter sp.]|uniref:polysaccharide deacetylase family protein n=1 Tax=Moheibacter sp. TaxID=1965316 RepID=UPI003C722B18